MKAEWSVEQKQKLAQTAKRYPGKPYDFSFSWSDDRQYCLGAVWRFTRTRWECAWRAAELKEFDLSNPLVRRAQRTLR
ncbi:YiiX/YebB-like N1pC/P60 family cysteine hydrolase [Shigella flexneri]